MVEQGLRTSDFKIGCFHGTTTPQKQSSEAQLRNEIYLTGMLEVAVNLKETINIRLLAYELPLEKENPRGKCIDLLGYDSNMVPYIIELKRASSDEDIKSIVKQINGYEEDFNKIREHVAMEVREKYFWPCFRFTCGTGKIILAPRTFYEKCISLPAYKSGIFMCSFADLQDDPKTNSPNILKKCGSKGRVRLKVENK